MSGRVKIKSKTVKATLANKDVLDMFHGVLGTSEGAASLSITHPKYLRIRNHVERFIKLLTVLLESNLMALFPGPKGHLNTYVAALRVQLAENFGAPDLSKYLQAGLLEPTAEDYAKIPPEVVSQFGETFGAMKKCSLVNTIIVTCKNLVVHKKALQEQTALSDRFLRGAGMSFCPLPDLPQVNFKQVYIDDRLSPGDREFVLVVLHKLFTISHDVYEAASSPDVDVNEFVEVIMSSINEVKKHIQRCDQAFQKIIESVSLLKGNFDGYYKDFVASNNPTIIMENFVIDVSKTTNSTPAVTAQFRRIISHYRKLASQQASHPKLQSLFQQVDKNFQELETRSKKADAADSSEDDESSDDGEEPAPAPATPVPAPATPAPAPATPALTPAAPAPTAPAAPAPTAPAAPAPTAPARKAGNRRNKMRPRAKGGAKDGDETLADELDRGAPGGGQ